MIMQTTKRLWPLVLATAVLTACASYSPSSRQVVRTDMADWHVVNNLAVAADPYLKAERQKVMFDADLTSANVLAVHVAAENRGDGAMLVRPSDMQLMFPDGRAYAPTGVSTTVVKVGESGSVVGAGLAFGLIGVLVAANAESESRNARIVDYGQKAFPEKYLAKGERAEGAVFFIPPMSICQIRAATLRVRFVDPESAALETIDVPLPAGAYGQMVEAAQNAGTASNANQASSDPGASDADRLECKAL